MKDSSLGPTASYTCNDYRMEMRLLGIRQQLAKGNLSDEERKRLEAEMNKLEKDLGMS